MTGTRIREFPVKNFEYIFTPPGLPLVAKGSKEYETTSILVRGGAGTGKTTLTVAVAHAIARTGGGVVLYVTTEFAPAEIVYKASMLRLPEGAVLPWGKDATASPGSVVVQHLSLMSDGDPPLTSVERKRGAIDGVWELLHPEHARECVPVRAVVIDAFSLPDPGQDELSLRGDLVGFVQALEGEGVSTVIVEELGTGASDWLSFVVDVVCELSFATEPETGELHRKLKCTKSRYATSLPGPHDYGLTEGVPCLWPDLLRVITAPFGSPFPEGTIKTLPAIIPLANFDVWVRMENGGILAYSHADPRPLNALSRVPGVRATDILCGPITIIEGSINDTETHDDEGAHSIGWAALEKARVGKVNLLHFRDLDGLLSRPRFHIPLLHVIDALRYAGILVLIQLQTHMSDGPIVSMADVVWPNIKIRHKDRVLTRRHRSAAGWLIDCTSLMTNVQPVPLAPRGTIQKVNPIQVLHSQLMQVRQEIEIGHLKAAKARIAQIQLGGGDVDYHVAVIENSLLSSLLGARGPQNQLRGAAAQLSGRPELSAVAGWVALATGREWEAAHIAFDAVATESPHDSLMLLWAAVCATQTENTAAIDVLKASLPSSDPSLLLGPLLQALAAQGRLDEADRAIHELSALPPNKWVSRRLIAEMRLDATDPAIVREGAELLTKLVDEQGLPVIHQADVCHNLGVAKDRLGQPSEAIPWFKRALGLNPYLEATREELARLDPSFKPPFAPA